MPPKRRKPHRKRNPFAAELWSPLYRQRIVRDARKHMSKWKCRTLYQPSEEA